MTELVNNVGGRALARLHSLKRAVAPDERCDLCAAKLEVQHKHFVECTPHKLLCVCDMCAILLDGKGNQRYRRVSSEIRQLSKFRMAERHWQALGIPVSLAFLYATDSGSSAFSILPSPGGPVRSEIESGAWEALVRENPVLCRMQPYVEALAVNRIKNAEEYLLVPIDECYRLIGIIRCYWQGMSGGTELQEHVAECFREWRERAISQV